MFNTKQIPHIWVNDRERNRLYFDILNSLIVLMDKLFLNNLNALYWLDDSFMVWRVNKQKVGQYNYFI